MDPIVLSTQGENGERLQATFLPDKGMNLISFRWGDIEIIDQSTSSIFEERFAGLGALIGPHFHRRRPDILPKINDESLFPHIARVKEKGGTDPFSHGIARYAPWQAKTTETTIKALLTGKDLWNGISLATLEGQNFTMHFDVELTSKGLALSLDVVSETDSLAGIHYYYSLPKGSGTVTSNVQPLYIEKGEKKALPSTWNIDSQQRMVFNLDEEADFTFFPFPNPREGKIILNTGDYELQTTYLSNSQENSWQLYHPKGASFVCIEPISSQDPRHPNLTASSIKIKLSLKFL